VTAYRYVVADVFTDAPLEGNGLAVFTDASALPEHRLQPLARELNLSETVFALPAEQGGDARIRIFTPGRELPFAGHPVLGSAVVLGAGAEAITLETGLGPVTVELAPTGTAAVFGRMTQPHPTLEPFADAPALLAALHLERSELPLTELYVNGPRNAYVALPSEDAVIALAPDLEALRAVGAINVSCFAVTGMRVKTRVFAPSLGVAEDPATGSAAGPLALHLARHGAIEWGQEIEISQGAEINRPSRLYARVTGSADAILRIEVAGAAVVVARGEFEL
jgi:trans-2,3-dihydro-3-hydroxyanthranilate isomerase